MTKGLTGLYRSWGRNTRGYVFAFIATFSMANVYVFSKAALSQLNLIVFGFYWFGLAFLWSALYLVLSGRIRLVRQLDRKGHFLLILIGLLEMIAAILLFSSIKIMPNPSVVSFLQNLTPLFVTAFGFWFLKERFTKPEAIGIALILAGALLISYSGQKSFREIFTEGTGMVVLSSLFMSASIILTKGKIVKIDPSILTINRIAYIFFLSLLLVLINNENIRISSYAAFNVFAGSLLGPFLTGLAHYYSLQYIEASRSTIFQSTRGLLVVIGVLLYLGIAPRPNELTGGLITIAGVALLTLGKRIQGFTSQISKSPNKKPAKV